MNSIFENLKKHNFWYEENIRTGIPRQKVMEQITTFSGNRLIKVLAGQRRTGKSYILRQLIRSLIDRGINPKNIFYLDKENLDFAELTNSKDLNELIQLYLENLKIIGKVFLLLDEVQEIAGWEKLVSSYAQNNQQEYEIYITGSNSHMLSSELGTYLSGRYVSIDVFPLSFPEFVTGYNVQPDKSGLIDYLHQGGLPELINLKTTEAKRHYVMALRDSILLNDIVKKFGIQDVSLLERLFHFLCSNIGSLFSINKLVHHLNSKGIKTSFETLSRYVDYLERALLIPKLSDSIKVCMVL